jgi:hypothetical protein
MPDEWDSTTKPKASGQGAEPEGSGDGSEEEKSE